MQLLIQVSIHAHFIAFLKNALVDQLLFFSLSRVSPEVLGNKGTKLYKSEEKSIASKFMKRGVNNLHSAYAVMKKTDFHAIKDTSKLEHR